MLRAAYRWLDHHIFDLGRELRLSYLPPLMVYLAAGVSELTGIVGTFFVKEYLGLSAAFLAALGFWAVIPWTLKMPLGHLVDLLWRYKAGLIYLGAALIAASLIMMIGLIAHTDTLRALMPVEAWYVLSTLLAPIGYVIQDVVADAMTVEAVPRVDHRGQPFDPETRRRMHTTMQTLGRVAIIEGTMLVALVNLYVFRGAESLSQAAKAATYAQVYRLALIIPVVSVLGVLSASLIRLRDVRRLQRRGFSRSEAHAMLGGRFEPTRPNWWILGGGLAFALFTVSIGVADLPFSQEIVFIGSMAIVLFLMRQLVRALAPDARRVLIGTAVIIFVYRAVPTPGPGVTWWMIDVLGFDPQFLALLSLIGSGLTLAGMFIFRRFMAEKSIANVVGTLTIAGTLLGLPVIGLYYGLHEWTAAHTGGLVDARFIVLVDTALSSPLGQIAMIPMLAWIANSAPESLKATFFAVMGSFANLALSAAQLGTKYLNRMFVVTREVKDPVTGAIKMPADYSEMGALLVTAGLIGLLLPFAAIALARLARLKSA